VAIAAAQRSFPEGRRSGTDVSLDRALSTGAVVSLGRSATTVEATAQGGRVAACGDRIGDTSRTAWDSVPRRRRPRSRSCWRSAASSAGFGLGGGGGGLGFVAAAAMGGADAEAAATR